MIEITIQSTENEDILESYRIADIIKKELSSKNINKTKIFILNPDGNEETPEKSTIQDEWIKVDSKNSMRNILLYMKFPLHTFELTLDYLENTNRYVTMNYGYGMLGCALHEIAIKHKNGIYYYKIIY